ncbi:MAG: porin [Thermodesulfobacteriota bacterium]|nr:MAG: porin [Thermodesulfobacteriota bacterium]
MKSFALSIGLFVSLFVLTPLSWAGQGYDRLLDLLVEKGSVSKEDAASLRAEEAVREQEEKENQKEFFVIAGRPVKLGGYAQVRYRNDESIKDTFDVRRARLDLRAAPTERLELRLQTELAGSSAKILDATAAYAWSPGLRITAGQFLVPFSLENVTSNTKLETINRSQVVEALVARGSDVIGNHNGRDTGVQASGSLIDYGGRKLVEYSVGVFNGSGINRADQDEQKDIIGRVAFRVLNDLSIGTSVYEGSYTGANRDRVGVEFAYTGDPFSIKGEYIRGEDGSKDKEGWYLQAGYFIIPKLLQGVVKFDTFDPDKGVSKNETDVYTAGANIYFNKWSFLQVNYEDKREKGTKVDNNALTGQLTVQF